MAFESGANTVTGEMVSMNEAMAAAELGSSNSARRTSTFEASLGRRSSSRSIDRGLRLILPVLCYSSGSYRSFMCDIPFTMRSAQSPSRMNHVQNEETKCNMAYCVALEARFGTVIRSDYPMLTGILSNTVIEQWTDIMLGSTVSQ